MATVGVKGLTCHL